MMAIDLLGMKYGGYGTFQSRKMRGTNNRRAPPKLHQCKS